MQLTKISVSVLLAAGFVASVVPGRTETLILVSVSVLLAAGFVASVVPGSRAQQRPAPNKELIAARHATEDALAEIAIIDRKLMVPMRDGKRMATDVYRPKDTSKAYPII